MAKHAKHPIQPLEKDKDGRLRFKENAIVRYLLDNGPNDMNKLATMPFSQEDRQQFAQLIGYSLSGYGELSYVSDDAYKAAAEMAQSGKSDKDARIETIEKTLSKLREGLRAPVSELFGIHPDDLKGE
jgi:hypothetical protein